MKLKSWSRKSCSSGWGSQLPSQPASTLPITFSWGGHDHRGAQPIRHDGLELSSGEVDYGSDVLTVFPCQRLVSANLTLHLICRPVAQKLVPVTNLHLVDPGLWLAGGGRLFSISSSPLPRPTPETERRTSCRTTWDTQPDYHHENHPKHSRMFKIHDWLQTLTELPGEVWVVLQHRVAEGVSAIHQPGGRGRLDSTQGHYVRVLHLWTCCCILDAFL